MNSVDFSKKIIVAIDETSMSKISKIIDTTASFIDIYKIGSITFTAYGPDIIKEFTKMGKKVFLDLKFFDIPNTVSKAVKQAVSYGVKMLTLHTLGGYEMLRAAVEANNGEAILLGVTILTSIDQTQLERVGIHTSITDMVGSLASLALSAGVDGLVASGHELEYLRDRVGDKAIIVVPGIRLPGKTSADDQKRIVSPKKAFDAGADYIVIGRPVTESDNPEAVIREIMETLI
jgi:orotidine-5'-phosphate decarboxylase